MTIRERAYAHMGLALAVVIGASAAFIASSHAAPPAKQIDIQNLAYQPATLTVPVDTMVTWVNHDNVVHTATARSGEFNSGGIPTGGKYAFTFRTPGSFDFICTVHPQMKGTITVTAR